jgi:2,3-diketo-5-methylthio-1-phosphopentane phosphatase
MKHIVLDIEGTVAPADYVHNVLFPYSFKRMDFFLSRNSEKEIVQQCLYETREIIKAETGYWIGVYEAQKMLMEWIRIDRKAPPLKKLQGLIWQEGFERGHLVAPIYPDVKAHLEEWKKKKITLSVYSSGSIQAQQVFFKYSDAGDLSGYITHWYDLETGGPKRAVESYALISMELGAAPKDILFFSDVPAELDAAKAAGWNTVHVVRPGTESGGSHPESASLDLPKGMKL